MDKRLIFERDICSKFIPPALTNAGWDLQSYIAGEKFLTVGEIILREKLVARGKRKDAEYMFRLKPNIPIAAIEAKAIRHSVNDGTQQALSYADILQVPFALSSNGDGFVFHEKSGRSSQFETQLSIYAFPSPSVLSSSFWRAKSQLRRLTIHTLKAGGSLAISMIARGDLIFYGPGPAASAHLRLGTWAKV